MSDTFLLHGFNVRDGGAGTVGKLAMYVPGARMVSYGWLGLLGVRFFNDNLAAMLVSQLTRGCTVIGHSNAADVIYRALQLDGCPKIERVVLIRPALDRDVSFGGVVDRVDVFHHANDKPIGLSRCLPWHNWGAMGAVGYCGPEMHVVNHDEQLLFSDADGDHSAFVTRYPNKFGNYLRRLLG